MDAVYFCSDKPLIVAFDPPMSMGSPGSFKVAAEDKEVDMEFDEAYELYKFLEKYVGDDYSDKDSEDTGLDTPGHNSRHYGECEV